MRDPRMGRGGPPRRPGWGDDEFGHEHGPGPGHGPGRGRGPGGRTRRGDIRTALLIVLGDGPAHGYELIQRLEQRSSGRWRPSAGSVYPTLQLLEDEGLATAAEQDGKRVYTITEAGQEETSKRMARPDGSPWAFRGEGAGEHGELREAFGQLMMAFRQVAAAAKVEQVRAATEILTDARRKLYQLLAEG